MKSCPTVFVFHEVSDAPRLHARETRTFSDISTFEMQIRWISSNFEIKNFRDSDYEIERGGCVVSFDDGYAGLKTNALPVLRKYGTPIVNFINYATIVGGANSSALAMYVAKAKGLPVNWNESNRDSFDASLNHLSADELHGFHAYQGPYLSEQELDALSRDPLITIGDHLHNHWLIGTLTPEEFGSELKKNRASLKEYESYIPIFAPPHGVAPQWALDQLSHKDFQLIFAGKAVLSNGHQRILPRIDMNNAISDRCQFYGAIAISKIRIGLHYVRSRKGTR